ncbi:MAG: hypothetical protein KBT14_01935 [Proteobacteria bacterium]|nr:hypothetical protein [Candidatus Enterousia onthequi]
MVSQKNLGFWYTVCKGKKLRKSKEKSKYRESKNMSKKNIFLSIFSKITISVCVFCAFFISPVFATLPAGYTELEYIESTGTQWIDTGFATSREAKFGIKFRDTLYQADKGFFGSSSWNNSLAFYQTTIRYCLNNTAFSLNITNATHSGELISSSSGVVGTFDGQEISFPQVPDTNTGDGNIYLFSGGRNRNGLNTKIDWFKIWDSSDNLVRDFVPAKNASGVVGMYDTISGTFFTNQGTGSFIAGPIAHCKTFGTDGVACTACKSGYRLDNSGGCVEIIEIATTKMVDEEFAAAEAKLATTVQTIESVVSRTITQTGQIATLQAEKQTRPDESCPANMKCLLVQDEDGTPHWYPIIEP